MDRGAGGIESEEHLVPAVGRDVLVRKIDVRLDVGKEVEQVVADPMKAVRESPPDLLDSRLGREGGPGVDEIGHGLGLCEIQTAVEECTEGELTGFSQPGPSREECLEHLTRHNSSTVTGDLHGILLGEGPGRAQDGREDLVDADAVSFDVAMVDGVRGRFGEGFPVGSASPEDDVCDGNRPGPGDADHRDSACPCWGGDRGDGVGR